ncbi:C40 family peptidase [Acidicapsa acidisoli]|uniref:C40 family peptidase n=1 Tax=Acidicapsa acidisoli TaxID=1615681 RepID=UPI0021E06BCD|nr:SH3 domain-containing C40 family peptidase [Acidicapsa acidisoli]
MTVTKCVSGVPCQSKIAGNISIFVKRTSSLLTAGIWIIALFMPMARTGWAQESVPHPNFVVAKPVINMFAKAEDNSEVISQTIYGTDVATLEKHADWYNIRTADGYTGWVEASGLKALDAGTYAPDDRLVRVAGLSVNIYRDPDVTTHAPVLQLPWEARLELTSEKRDRSSRWLQVRLVDGQTAWVQQGDVAQDVSPLTIDEMLQLARRFLGITYTWGGVSSFGFDCSGFTQMLERQRGIIMPRDADIQAAWSGVTAVERKDLQPGDLLFFGGSTGKITHTGMYIGGGQFIHDTTHEHPGVQISRLDDMPWTKILVAARRVK